MRRPRIVPISLTLAAALAAAMVLAGVNDTEPPADPRSPARAEEVVSGAGETTPGAAGIRVYLDPETGEVLDRPTDPLSERLLDQRLSTYSGDLLEEALPEGGYKVDLRGRFQSAVVATIDPETDEVEIDCISAPATGEVRHEH